MKKDDQLIFEKLVDELGWTPQDERVDERIKELEAKLQEISRECENLKSTNPDDWHDALNNIKGILNGEGE